MSERQEGDGKVAEEEKQEMHEVWVGAGGGNSGVGGAGTWLENKQNPN